MRLSRAQDRNVFVTKTDTASRLGLARISDLARYWQTAGCELRARPRARALPRAPRGDRAPQPRLADLVRARQEDVRDVPRRPSRRRPARALVRGARRACRRRSWRASPSTTSARRTSGHRGWIGVHLNTGLDWNEIAGAIEDAYAEIAPKSLVERACSKNSVISSAGTGATSAASIDRASGQTRLHALARGRRVVGRGAQLGHAVGDPEPARGAVALVGQADAAGVDEARRRRRCGRAAGGCGRRRRSPRPTPSSASA